MPWIFRGQLIERPISWLIGYWSIIWLIHCSNHFTAWRLTKEHDSILSNLGTPWSRPKLSHCIWPRTLITKGSSGRLLRVGLLSPSFRRNRTIRALRRNMRTPPARSSAFAILLGWSIVCHTSSGNDDELFLSRNWVWCCKRRWTLVSISLRPVRWLVLVRRRDTPWWRSRGLVV